MQIDKHLNKKYFKLFGFPVYGWFIVMVAIFVLVYFSGSIFLNAKIEQEKFDYALFQIDSLQNEFDRETRELDQAFEYIREKQLENKFFKKPALNAELKSIKPEAKKEAEFYSDKELYEVLKIKSYLAYKVDKVNEKHREVLAWLLKTDPAYAMSPEDASGTIEGNIGR